VQIKDHKNSKQQIPIFNDQNLLSRKEEREKRKEERAKRIRETTSPASPERVCEHLTKRDYPGRNFYKKNGAEWT
jgi:hypothetical protein